MVFNGSFPAVCRSWRHSQTSKWLVSADGGWSVLRTLWLGVQDKRKALINITANNSQVSYNVPAVTKEKLAFILCGQEAVPRIFWFRRVRKWKLYPVVFPLGHTGQKLVFAYTWHQAERQLMWAVSITMKSQAAWGQVQTPPVALHLWFLSYYGLRLRIFKWQHSRTTFKL